MGGVAAGTSPGVVTGETLGSVAEEKTLRGGSRNPRRDDFLAPRDRVSPAGATLWRPDCVSPAARTRGIRHRGTPGSDSAWVS